MKTALLAGKHRVVDGWRHPRFASRLQLAAPPLSPLPSSHTIAKIPTAQDQGSVGDCAGQTGRECMTGVALRQGKGEELFSCLYLYWWARNYDGTPPDIDGGTFVETIFRVLHERGCPLKSTWDDYEDWKTKPSDAADGEALNHKGVLAFALPSLLTMKASIVAGFACGFGFDVPSQMMSLECAQSGMVEYPSGSDGWDGGGHAVTAWGYDDSLVIGASKGAFLCLNHWSQQWGIDGRFWLPYDFWLTGHASDAHTLRLAGV